MLALQPSAKPKRRAFRDIYHAEIIEMLHYYNAFTRSQETGKFVQEEPGSADILVHLNGGCAVEVKTGFNGVFNFSTWRENQRKWAEDYRAKTGNEYWLAVIIETPLAPWKTQRKKRAAFLVPYEALILTADLLPQASIPYKVGKGMLLEMQEHQYDAITMWQGYVLDWVDGRWNVPQKHDFYTAYIAEREILNAW